jgi:hypothetical protein
LYWCDFSFTAKFVYILPIELYNIDEIHAELKCTKKYDLWKPVAADNSSKHNINDIRNKECILRAHNFEILYISNQVWFFSLVRDIFIRVIRNIIRMVLFVCWWKISLLAHAAVLFNIVAIDINNIIYVFNSCIMCALSPHELTFIKKPKLSVVAIYVLHHRCICTRLEDNVPRLSISELWCKSRNSIKYANEDVLSRKSKEIEIKHL